MDLNKLDMSPETLQRIACKLTDAEIEAFLVFSLRNIGKDLAGYIFAFRHDGSVTVSQASTNAVSNYPGFVEALNTVQPVL